MSNQLSIITKKEKQKLSHPYTKYFLTIELIHRQNTQFLFVAQQMPTNQMHAMVIIPCCGTCTEPIQHMQCAPKRTQFFDQSFQFQIARMF